MVIKNDKIDQVIISSVPSTDDGFIGNWFAMPEANPDTINIDQVSGLNMVLPQLTNIPGYIVGWVPVTTVTQDNKSRTVAAAQQGWRPIAYTEYRQYDPVGADTFRMRAGSADVIQIKDLVAAKIPLAIYKKLQQAQAKMITQNTKNTIGASRLQNSGYEHLGVRTRVEEYSERHTVVDPTGSERITRQSSETNPFEEM